MAAASPTPSLTADAVRAVLQTRRLGRSLHVFDETDSTNTAALAMAREGAADGTVVIADRQTAGRGRLGREWHSPPGCNLYWSVLLKPPSQGGDLSRWLAWVPLSAGVSVAEACERVTKIRVRLKWPNDILLSDKKVGGILCESVSLQREPPIIVVGIGLNVNGDPGSYPEAFRASVTSLAAEAGRSFDRIPLLAASLAALEQRWEKVGSNGAQEVVEEYSARCSTIGREVRVTLASGEVLQGIASRIEPDGALAVVPGPASAARQVGTTVVVRAGDVVHVR